MGPTPTHAAVPPPVAFTSTGGGCEPILSHASTLTADVCACVAEPMTVVDYRGPQGLACDGTVGILSGSVVTVSTARWSITQQLGVVDPHCWITARLVCKP